MPFEGAGVRVFLGGLLNFLLGSLIFVIRDIDKSCEVFKTDFTGKAVIFLGLVIAVLRRVVHLLIFLLENENYYFHTNK